jgi:TolB protein
LYRYRGEGSDEVGVAENIRDVAFDRSGQQIVFIRDVTYPAADNLPETTVGEVFIAPLDDLNAAQQITTLRIQSARSPIFNPNGREIMFVSNYDGDDELWIIDPTTQVTRQITNNETQDRDPSWSPDGNVIVYAADRASPGFFDLYVLAWTEFTDDPAVANESGYPVRELLNETGSSTAPAWSLDGTRLVFVNDQEGDTDIYTIEANGERMRLVNGDEGAEDRDPSWSPDGRSVIWVSNREAEVFQVYSYTLADRQLQQLTTGTRNVESASYQPDVRFRLTTE